MFKSTVSLMIFFLLVLSITEIMTFLSIYCRCVTFFSQTYRFFASCILKLCCLVYKELELSDLLVKLALYHFYMVSIPVNILYSEI